MPGVTAMERGDQLGTLSDAELVANHLAHGGGRGGSVWLHELFRRHYARVVICCLRAAGDREQACDLAQSIFIKVQSNLASFRGKSKVSTWLYSIARSECLNFLRARRPQEHAAEEQLAETASAEPGPDEVLERLRSARLARKLLDQALDETEKKIFTLHYGEDVPLDAITRLLGLANPSGAKAYIVSARRKLARAVRQWRAQQETESRSARWPWVRMNGE